jgi:hypothetical protein
VNGVFDGAGVLTRSLHDVTDVRPCKKLPLIGEIYAVAARLSPLSAGGGAGGAGGGAHTVVYTNMDIGVVPGFYEVVGRLARACPGFGLCRRTIPADMLNLSDVGLMGSLVGTPYGGIDAFVCPRAALEGLDLKSVVIGLPTIEYAVMAAIDAHCARAGLARAKELTEHHLLFHHGEERAWGGRENEALRRFNEEQTRQAVEALVAGPRPEQLATPGSLLAFYLHKMRRRHAQNQPVLKRALAALGLSGGRAHVEKQP